MPRANFANIVRRRLDISPLTASLFTPRSAAARSRQLLAGEKTSAPPAGRVYEICAKPPIRKASALSAGLVNASILLYTLWLLLPAVQTTGGAAAGAFCVLLFGAGVLLDGAYLKARWWDFALRALCAALLPLVLRVWLHRGGGHFFGFYAQQGMFWFPLLYCAYARLRQDARLWRFLPAVLGACLLLTTLTTLYWLVEGMLRGGKVYAYSRSLGSGEPGREAYLKELMLRNIGGYDFIYAAVLCLPLSCFGMFRSRGWKRAGWAGLCLLLAGMIALSQYTYALVFALVLAAVELTGALARLLSRKLLKKPMGVGLSLVWGLCPLVLVFLLRVPLVSGAAALCGRLGLVNFAYSLEQLLNVLVGNGVDSASRLEFYRLPLEGMARSPWLGSLLGAEPMLSQHSDILDLFSGMGLLGGGLVLALIAWMGRGLLKGIKASPALPHLVLQWVCLMACACLGTVVYSRDISLILCCCALLALEMPCKSLTQGDLVP